MDLRQIGLSEYEARVYEALVKLGKTTATQVSQESKVSQGRIYDVLSSLERKGLVRVIPEETKKFVVSDIENINRLVNEKITKLKKLHEEVKSLKKVYEIGKEEAVMIAKGKKNFYKIIREMPLAAKREYAVKYTSEYNALFVKDVKKLLRKKVDIKSLTRYDEETKKDVKKWLKITKNIKEIENEGVVIDIVDDEIVMIVLIKKNTIILIRDKAFSDVLATLFNDSFSIRPKITEK